MWGEGDKRGAAEGCRMHVRMAGRQPCSVVGTAHPMHPFVCVVASPRTVYCTYSTAAATATAASSSSSSSSQLPTRRTQTRS